MTNPHDIMAEPRYSTADLAKATRVPAETIRTWFKRKILNFNKQVMGEDVERVGLGRSYSAYTAVLVAIMGKLTAGGMGASDAREAANQFVFSAVGTRLPGCLFYKGETALVIAKDFHDGIDREGIVQSRIATAVVNIGETAPDFFALFAGKAEQIEVLRLTKLWLSVVDALDLRDQLEANIKKAAEEK